MPAVNSKPFYTRKRTALPSDDILSILMCLPRMQVTRSAYAGSTFAGPLLAHGAALPLRDIAIGCNHPDNGVAIHGGIHEDFITVLPITDFKERLQAFKKHVYIVRLYISSPIRAPDGVVLSLRPHFDTLITHVLGPVRHLLANADVEVSQTPTDDHKLSPFMQQFSEARTFRLVADFDDIDDDFVPMSVWWDACLGYGKNIYGLEVSLLYSELAYLFRYLPWTSVFKGCRSFWTSRRLKCFALQSMSRTFISP